MFNQITVTFDGHSLAQVPRTESFKAHALQIAAFWNFNASYHSDSNGKLLSRNVKLFFEFVLIYLWELKPRYVASTSQNVKTYPIDQELLDFWEEVLRVVAAAA